MELALGTAQFGMNYGIAGRGEMVPGTEVQFILKKAWEFGIRAIDTASCYGDIEKRLVALMGDDAFRIVSKIPALPRDLTSQGVEDHVSGSIQRSRARLGERLGTLLFHHGADLLGHFGGVAWRAATQTLSDSSIQLGASCYAPDEVIDLKEKHPLQVVQIPGNAFDQRILTTSRVDDIEIHLRSVFLQGILLLESNQLVGVFPKALPMIQRWRDWCSERILSPLEGALSVVKGLPNIRYCVIGVQHMTQLESIVEAWDSAKAIHAPELAIDNIDIIDPRRWSLAIH